MLLVTKSAHITDCHRSAARGTKRLLGSAFIFIRYSAILALSASALSGHAFAAYRSGLRMISGNPVIQVGQQQAGHPFMLHGVFEGFDARAHRLKLAHLDEIDFSWAETMRNVEVDAGVSMSEIEPGMEVTATLKRRLDGTYYVSRLTKG